MREQIVQGLLKRLKADAESISRDFHKQTEIRTKFATIDDLLPEDLVVKIHEAFPPTDKMRLMKSFRELKYTSKALNEFAPLISDITFAFQDERVVTKVAEITRIEDAVGDPHLYAGGISAMAKGHFLNPHLDNSHDMDQKHYRVLNLLYYITPNWKTENGGNLELWDERVRTPIEITSKFNRLVLMSTNDRSWHSVNRVRSDGKRCCISNYYFSPHSPNGYETTHVTYFQARPEQTIRRLVTKVDSELRTAIRKVIKKGIGKKDTYG